jgi:DNA-binding HxlR family transcriptional regulator
MSMADKRTYGDSCGIARALDLVGERWALLVVRELLLGPKRFTDLRAGLPSISPDVLAQRLRELEGAGIVRRRKLPPPASARVYELTERGAELEPVLLSLGRWGSRSALPANAAELSPDALAVALKTVFDPSATDGLERSYQVQLGEHAFSLRVAGGEIEIARGDAPAPAVRIETDPGTLADVLWHGRPVGEAVEAGALILEGSRREVGRFLKLFPPPAADRARGLVPDPGPGA